MRHYKQRTWRGLELLQCAARSEAQKYKFVENCVWINGRRVPVVLATETAI